MDVYVDMDAVASLLEIGSVGLLVGMGIALVFRLVGFAVDAVRIVLE